MSPSTRRETISVSPWWRSACWISDEITSGWRIMSPFMVSFFPLVEFEVECLDVERIRSLGGRMTCRCRRQPVGSLDAYFVQPPHVGLVAACRKHEARGGEQAERR